MRVRNTSWPDLGDSPEKPHLRLAALGFPDSALITEPIRRRHVVLPWEPVPLHEADAVWICGSAARVHSGHLVEVVPPHGEPLLIDPRAKPRLTFFSLPLADKGVKPSHTFDPTSESSLEYAFRQAETVLRPLAMELLLGHEIAENLPMLRAHRYELTRRGSLVAVVDFGGAVGISPRLALGDVQRAVWRALRQPRGIPEHFHVTTFAELFARYIDRVETDLLPTRYRQLPIHLRQGVRVPPKAMQDEHRAILRQLQSEALTYEELEFRLQLRPAVLRRALAVLFYASAITTNPARSRAGVVDSVPFSHYPAAGHGSAS